MILAKALLLLSLPGKLEIELTKENLQQKKGNYMCPSSLDNYFLFHALSSFLNHK